MLRLLIAFAFVAAITGAAAAAEHILPPPTSNFSTVVKDFRGVLFANDTLRKEIEASIAISHDHGPNSADPWTIEDLLAHWDRCLYHVPAPPDSNSTNINYHDALVSRMGDLMFAPWWETSHDVKAFTRMWLATRNAFFYSKETASAVSGWISWGLKTNPDRIPVPHYINATFPKYTLTKAMDLAYFEVPATGFASYGDFFGRRYTEALRTKRLAKTGSDISAAVDGFAGGIFTNLSLEGRTIKAKGSRKINLVQMLQSRERAAAFVGGTGQITFLGPWNHHRWTAPMDGVIDHVDILGDQYYGTYGNCKSTFNWCQNWAYAYHRAVIYINASATAEAPKGYRFVAVFIGMQTVGSVIPEVKAGDYVKKGDPLGQFDLGGSATFFGFDASVNVTFAQPPGWPIFSFESFAKVSA